MKPFLKWAGGKTRLVSTIQGLLPLSGRLIEPFMGSGAVFMGVPRESYLGSDINADLIELYKALKSGGQPFIETCRDYFQPENNCVEAFMAYRQRFNTLSTGNRERAALFVYLNRHCFNGLCRYNAGGGFNVGFGTGGRPRFPQTEMEAFGLRLNNPGVGIQCQDFKATMASVVAGDVVYCDPPYYPLSVTASFSAYAKGGFSVGQQQELADECKRVCNLGATCVVSNHDTEFTRNIYKGSFILGHRVRRYISGNKGTRNKAAELFAIHIAKDTEIPSGLRALLDGTGTES